MNDRMNPATALKSLFLMVLLTMAANLCLAAKPTATVDRNKVTLDESFNLTLRLPGQSLFLEPDLSSLHQDFEVLNSRKNSQYSLINGKSTSYTDWTISLMAKRTGALVIPPIELDGEQSDPIVVEVLESKNKGQSSNSKQAIFIETDLDREQVYVQAQLLYTVRLYHAVSLGRGASLNDPEPNNTFVRKLGEESYEKILAGVRYNVIERKYALFPQSAGNLSIPSLTFNANVPTRRNQDPWGTGFGQSKHVRLRTKEHNITVLNKPAQYPNAAWLPSEQVTVFESWSGNPDKIEVGQSITRSITLTGEGVLAAQLPDLNSRQIPGLKFYPDQAILDDKEQPSGITGKQTQSVAVIPTQPGTYELPEQRIQWWDVNRQTVQEASLPKRIITVVAAAASNYYPDARSTPGSDTVQLQDPTQISAQQPIPDLLAGELTAKSTTLNIWYWPVISVILLLAWVYSSWQWFRYRRIAQSLMPGISGEDATIQETEKAAFKHLKNACETNDALATRATLLNWAKVNWPADKIQSLNDLGSLHTCGTSLLECIRALESSLFSNDTTRDWNGKQLLEAVALIRKKQGQMEKQKANTLPPLHQTWRISG